MARAKASRSLRPGRCPAHRPTGYWSNSYHCYISPVEPQPPAGDPSWQGHEPGDGAVYNCYQPQTGLLITIWSQDPPPELRHRTDAARGGADRDRADAPVGDQHRHRARAGSGQHRPGRHAGLDVGQGTRTTTPSARSPRAPLPAASRSRRPRRSSTSPGTWATAPRSSAIRRARRTSRSTGGRTPPTAATPTRSRAPAETDDAYTVTATSSWVITWSGAGQTGTIRLDGLNRSTQIRIGEAQVLVN